jgi:hypothetical protein
MILPVLILPVLILPGLILPGLVKPSRHRCAAMFLCRAYYYFMVWVVMYPRIDTQKK